MHNATPTPDLHSLTLLPAPSGSPWCPCRTHRQRRCHTRRRRQAHTHNPIPASDATGSTHLHRRSVTNRWYCSLDKNCRPGRFAVGGSHQQLPEPVNTRGQAKTPIAVAMTMQVTGNATQNHGNPGALPRRVRRGTTTAAANPPAPEHPVSTTPYGRTIRCFRPEVRLHNSPIGDTPGRYEGRSRPLRRRPVAAADDDRARPLHEVVAGQFGLGGIGDPDCCVANEVFIDSP